MSNDNSICLSGGAEGADLQWGMVAGESGHTVYHFIFDGHRSRAPKSELVVLKESQLVLADPFLEKANKTLIRKVSNKPFTRNLLRRNYYQIKDTESVYVISTIKDGKVEGGTAWAVQMFIDRFDNDIVPVYVFDQTVGKWFTWGDGWEAINSPPIPNGVWTGIGTRDLNDLGKKAIRELLKWKKINY